MYSNKEIMPERICKGCNESKTIDNFNTIGTSKKTSKPIYRHKCKSCMKVNLKRWEVTNQDLREKYSEKWRSNNKEHLDEYRRNYHINTYNPEKRHIKYIKYMYGEISIKNMV